MAIADEYGSIRITAIVGSSHSKESAHYDGLSIDIDLIGGTKIASGSHSQEWYKTFTDFAINELGASTVLHDPYLGHNDHMHIEWR